MAITYSIPNGLDGNPSKEIICRNNEDGTISWIPTDPANVDYQRYLNPEAEHFTPNLTPAE